MTDETVSSLEETYNETYTKEELDKAAEELAALTPETYLSMVKYINGLEHSRNLPEAPVSFNVNLSGEGGTVLSSTVRGFDYNETMDRLVRGIKYAKDKYKLSSSPIKREIPKPQDNTQAPQTKQSAPPVAGQSAPVKSAPPIVQQNPQPAENTTVIDVIAVSHLVGKGGSPHYINVKGGQWRKFGIPAYEEVVPVSMRNFTEWPVQEEYTEVPPELAKALVNVEKKKVIKFL